MSWINVVMTNYQEIQVALLLKIEIYIQVVVYTLFQSPSPLYPNRALLLFSVGDVMVRDMHLFPTNLISRNCAQISNASLTMQKLVMFL